jgi:uncharacterized membrane protein
MMMDMTGMSAGMMIGMSIFWLLVIAFLVLGIAAGIKYLRSPSNRASRQGSDSTK